MRTDKRLLRAGERCLAIMIDTKPFLAWQVCFFGRTGLAPDSQRGTLYRSRRKIWLAGGGFTEREDALMRTATAVSGHRLGRGLYVVKAMHGRSAIHILLSVFVLVVFTPIGHCQEDIRLVVPDNIQSVLNDRCVACHGADTAEADVRLDSFATLKLDARLELLNKVQDQLFFGTMPPGNETQPTNEEKTRVAVWVRDELRTHNASNLDKKLRYPDFGNYVDHEKLFSGEIKDKPFTPARRWLVSPQIFHERVNDVFGLPDRARQPVEAEHRQPIGRSCVEQVECPPQARASREAALEAAERLAGHSGVRQGLDDLQVVQGGVAVQLRLLGVDGHPFVGLLCGRAARVEQYAGGHVGLRHAAWLSPRGLEGWARMRSHSR